MVTTKRAALIAALITLTAGTTLGAGTASAATTHGGQPLIITTDSGDEFVCTLTGTTTRDGVTYGFTAGHCLNPGELDGEPMSITTADGDLLADRDGITAGGSILQGEASPENPDAGLADFSWFRLDAGADARNVVASTARGVDLGLFNLALVGGEQDLGEPVDVSTLHPGQIVCKDGAMTGRTCGPIISVTPASGEVFAAVPAIAGDSGSPMHVTGSDGRQHIVASLSNGTPVLFNVFDGVTDHLAGIN